MVQYKLNYFNIRGRGEIIRLVFAAGGQKFEDHRIEFAQWPEFKPKTPFGQLPSLEIHDGNHVTNLSQSIAICNFHIKIYKNRFVFNLKHLTQSYLARYLARKFGLAGKNDLESAEIEMYKVLIES